MRKFLLSGFVILAFVVFAIHQRSEGSNVAVIPPSSLVSNQTSSQGTSSSIPGASGPPFGQTQTQPQLQSQPTSISPGKYKDGTYTGDVADAYYGNLQVQVVISGGKITDVKFLDYPQDRSTSRAINSQAMPYLKAEAIAAQSANVDGVSGASASSTAFVQSLQSALAKAI